MSSVGTIEAGWVRRVGRAAAQLGAARGECSCGWWPPVMRYEAIPGNKRDLQSVGMEGGRMSQKVQAKSQVSSQPIALPGSSLELDIEEELSALHQTDAWRQTGISRKSLVRYPDFRISLIALRAERGIEEHRNPGRISVQPVVGHIRMQAAGKLVDLPKGKILVLDRNVTHDVKAMGQDSAFLLTVAFPEAIAGH
jgi:quercetin dioxygenase-like cupin family protein